MIITGISGCMESRINSIVWFRALLTQTIDAVAILKNKAFLYLFLYFYTNQLFAILTLLAYIASGYSATNHWAEARATLSGAVLTSF